MSNSIDTRVVEMKFDNAQFGRGVADTLKSLENLKKATKLEGAGKGLEELNKHASHFNIGNIANGVQTIASRFSTMGVVGVTALASIATQAIATGAAMVKNLTVAPLQAGLQEYETNLNSIQTILANTGLEGQKGLDQVNKALGDLNTYSDQTIYNFSEMARNIGTFTAAGIKLEPATAAIKGIANLAAISGSNAEQASTAMYQLSQAMAAGKATLVDWNSVVNAGMGGKVFQEALKETARVQGVAIDDIIKKNGSFRDSLQEGWLTTSVLTETLQKFTGDLTETQLKAMGYNEQQIAGIIKMGKTAQDAATKVKTVSQLINTLQEAAGSGWAKTFQLMFGDFDEARTLFTNVNNVLGGFIQHSADARNKVISDWKQLGGRTVLIQAIAIAFNDLMDILSPIKKAFRDIFPPVTGKQLFNLTVGFRNLMAAMRLNEGTMDNIRRTFRGLFAIVDIVIQVLKGLGTVIKDVFKEFSGGGSGILEFTGNIGDWLVALDKAIKSGTGFTNFFHGLAKVIIAPINGIKKLIGFIKELVAGIDSVASSSASKIGSRIADRFSPLEKVGKVVAAIWDRVLASLGDVFQAFLPLSDKFEEFFSNLGEMIKNAFAPGDFSEVLDGINTGLLAGLVLLFRKFVNGGLKLDFGNGALDALKDSLDGLSGTLGAMQANLKAGALQKIAVAIALLAVSVVALSLVDPKRLTSAMTGLAVMFAQLAGALALMDAVTNTKSIVKLPFIAAGLIGLALAVDLLAIAVSKLSKLNWEDLAKGLTGVAVLLGSLGLFTKFSSVNATSGASLILLALAINLLVHAVEDFAAMNWEAIAKGLTGVAGVLTALALFTRFSSANKGAVAQGAGLVLLALGVKVLADAVEKMGQLSWGEIARGLATMAGGLAAMAGALALVPPSSLLSAAGIFIVALSLSKIGDAVAAMGNLGWAQIAKGLVTMAGALTAISLAIGLLPPSSLLSAAAIFVTAASLGMIADALGQMGGMSVGEIAKSLITLSASLTILGLALYGMTAALPGAAALLVAASALKVLAPVLISFGDMSWVGIAKGLVMLAGVFLVFGAAGLILAPLIPVLIGLGAAIALLGVGMLAAGAGMFLFGTGLTAVAVAGSAAVAVLVGAVRAILNLLPETVTKLGQFVKSFADAINNAAPSVIRAMTTILLNLLTAIDRLAPRIIQTLLNLLSKLLSALVSYVPKMSDAGFKILLAVLNAIANNVGKMVTAGTTIVVKFLEGIGNNMPRVAQAGADLAIKFINSVADAIRNNSGAMGAAGGNLASAIIQGMVNGIAGGVGSVVSAAKNMAESALSAAKGALGINSPSKEFEDVGMFSDQGLAGGLIKFKKVVVKAADSVGNEAVESLRSSLSGISDIVTTDADFNPVIRPVLDLTDVQKNAGQIGSMLSASPIELTTSVAKAKDASTGFSANQQARQEAEASSNLTFEYTQVNQSPKALSNAEIYRQTRNQLSTVKGVLTNAN